MAPKPLPKTHVAAPDGRRFPWGPIQKVHTIGKYDVVEYLRDLSNSAQPEYWPEHGSVRFHPFIDGVDTNNTCDTLEEAIVLAIAVDRDGPNTRAHTYFMKATS